MERWMPVVGYEGYYEVSDNGRVRSVEREIIRSDGVRQTRKGAMKKQRMTDDGYMSVKLSKHGEDKWFYVHRLVAAAFLPTAYDGLEINHKDFDRKNNDANNLEWVTHEENIQRTIDAGRHVSQVMDFSGSNNPNYGNRTLSAKYASNKDLSLEKQSRPRGKNGRARSVKMISSDGTAVQFECITECAEYLHNLWAVASPRVPSIYEAILKAMKAGREYRGYTFLGEY